MKPAIIIVDMLKDNLKESARNPYRQARSIIPNIQRLLRVARQRGFPVVFACDSFLKEDFIFKGRMKVHSIRGTAGAEVIDDLKPEPNDLIVPKRRFSAFFKTDLDQTLRTYGVDTIVVTGISVEVCVLMTVLDGISHDFEAILLEDCSASRNSKISSDCLDLYRDFALHPLLRIMTSEQFAEEVAAQ